VRCQVNLAAHLRPAPTDLASAIERAYEDAMPLREGTAAWFRANARRLSLESSLEGVLASYADESSARR
jgi:hypothetical protein